MDIECYCQRKVLIIFLFLEFQNSMLWYTKVREQIKEENFSPTPMKQNQPDRNEVFRMFTKIWPIDVNQNTFMKTSIKHSPIKIFFCEHSGLFFGSKTSKPAIFIIYFLQVCHLNSCDSFHDSFGELKQCMIVISKSTQISKNISTF